MDLMALKHTGAVRSFSAEGCPSPAVPNTPRSAEPDDLFICTCSASVQRLGAVLQPKQAAARARYSTLLHHCLLTPRGSSVKTNKAALVRDYFIT